MSSPIHIQQNIHFIRGQKVILDSVLAELYGVPTKRLNEQVRRNLGRFPEDFMFQLTVQEVINLKSQIATSSLGHGGRRKLPLVFTEHGVIMAASVLNTRCAIEVSVLVVRAFVKLRQFLATHQELAKKLTELEKRTDKHDEAISSLFATIRQLMAPLPSNRKRIGFRSK